MTNGHKAYRIIVNVLNLEKLVLVKRTEILKGVEFWRK